jgi:cytokinin riboside 5'-monophosphate phosphoribohydrolase
MWERRHPDVRVPSGGSSESPYKKRRWHMSRTICVFCGSNAGSNPAIETAARILGSELAMRGFRLVFGGGSIGLMGALAKSMLCQGGEVIGVIPKALLDCEVGLVEVSELIVTDTMRERKAIMDKKADAFFVLPGGFGTMEEMMEVMTLRQLGFHNKPIILINIHGYYDPLVRFFDHAVEHGYVGREQNKRLYDVVASVDEAFAVLEAHL